MNAHKYKYTYTYAYFWKSGCVCPFIWEQQITFKIFIQLLLLLDNQESTYIGSKVSTKRLSNFLKPYSNTG